MVFDSKHYALLGTEVLVPDSSTFSYQLDTLAKVIDCIDVSLTLSVPATDTPLRLSFSLVREIIFNQESSCVKIRSL